MKPIPGGIERLPKINSLSEAFDRLKATPSSMHEHMDFIRECAGKASRVLELGVNQGTSCVSLLAGLKPGGEMISVDLQGPLTPIRFVLEWCAGEVRDRNWMFMQADTLAAMRRLRNWSMNFDLIFIDSSHQYELTLRELAACRAGLLADGGTILMHDTVAFEDDVKRAMMEFVAETGWDWEERTNCNGLGVIRHPG